MLKKIFLVLLILLLSSCNKEKPIEYDENSFVVPANNIRIFTQLEDNDLKDRLKKANNGNDFSNEQFKMLNKQIYLEDIVDINGNEINLKDYDKLVLEVAKTSCSTCAKLIKNHLDEILNKDVTLIQYFDTASKEDVLKLYEELNIQIPENIIIVGEEYLHDYVKETLKIDMLPTLVTFNNGFVSFSVEGNFSDEVFDYIYDISFVDPIDVNAIQDLINEYVSVDDVKNQISDENNNKLSSLDNDGFTLDLTYRLIGNKVDFENLPDKYSSVYMSEIDDYTYYLDKDLVLLYTTLNSNDETDKIDYLNLLIDSNSDAEYVVVFIEGLNSTSAIYKTMDTKIEDAKVVSNLGNIPKDFYKYGLSCYPSAIFIKKGFFAGAYSNINNVDEFKQAIDLFLTNSMALKVNN